MCGRVESGGEVKWEVIDERGDGGKSEFVIALRL